MQFSEPGAENWGQSVALLIALMLQFMFWLTGIKAQSQGWSRHFQANTVKNRNVLSTIRLGMEVLRRPGYEIATQQLLKDGDALADL